MLVHFPGVPALLIPAASTRTVRRSIFLWSLRSLPANVSGSSEEDEGNKGVFFPSSAGRSGCTGLSAKSDSRYCVSHCTPSGKGKAH